MLGVLPGIIGSLQALEAIKWILKTGELLAGRLLILDALDLRFREVRVSRDPACPVCGDHPTQKALIDYDLFCGLVASADSVVGSDPNEIGVEELAEALAGASAPVLVDVRDLWEWDVGNLEAKGAVHLPLAELTDRADELPEDRPVVAYCRTGNRSLDAAERLQAAGYAARSLRGGLVEWARKVDPTVPVA